LEATYPLIFFDALRMKTPDEGLVRNKLRTSHRACASTGSMKRPGQEINYLAGIIKRPSRERATSPVT
jgi:hypothetical protein